MSPQGSRDSRVSRVSRISVVPFFGELTNGKFEGKRQNKYTVNPVNPVKPVKSPPPGEVGEVMPPCLAARGPAASAARCPAHMPSVWQ
jgi:hypothetical protein